MISPGEKFKNKETGKVITILSASDYPNRYDEKGKLCDGYDYDNPGNFTKSKWELVEYENGGRGWTPIHSHLDKYEKL